MKFIYDTYMKSPTYGYTYGHTKITLEAENEEQAYKKVKEIRQVDCYALEEIIA